MATLLEERPSRASESDGREASGPSTHEVVVRVVGDGGPPRRRSGMGLRTMGILGGLVAIAVAIILLANAIGGFHLGGLFGSTTIDRSSPVVLKQLRDVSTYTAASGEFETTIDLEHDVNFLPSFIAGERTIFVGVGSVDATVDFSQLSASAVNVARDGAVTVTLPAPQLATPVVDPARSHVANRDRGFVNRIEGMFEDNPTSEQALYVRAQHRMAKAAQRSELQTRAERNTETMLKGLLGKLGFDRVTVQFT